MQKLIINASLKKTGTTFLHNLFNRNAHCFDSLIVPPIKEWYVIPRVEPIASRNKVHLQHALGEKAEILYKAESNDSHKEFLRRVANRPSGFYMSSNEIVERIIYLLSAYPNHSIVINDPNFLTDLCAISQTLKFNLIRQLSKHFDVKIFCIHRNFYDLQVSFAKMRFSVEGLVDQIPHNKIIMPYMFLNELINLSGIDNVFVYDFGYAMKESQNLIVEILESIGIRKRNNFYVESVPNPNPKQDFDYSTIDSHLKIISQKYEKYSHLCELDIRHKVALCDFVKSLRKIEGIH